MNSIEGYRPFMKERNCGMSSDQGFGRPMLNKKDVFDVVTPGGDMDVERVVGMENIHATQIPP